MTTQHIQPGTRIGCWTIIRLLGEGGFGAVYEVHDPKGMSYALKVEDVEAKNQLLQMEVLVLEELARNQNRHFCAIHDKGHYGNWNYVVMTMVGSSLHDLRKATRSQHFSMGTALGVSIQALEAIEDLHTIGYLHRDVKPGNYTIGRAENHELRKVYLLDFGMARKFTKEISNPDGSCTIVIRRPRTVAGFRGTLRYAAMGVHEARDQCRKDDVEGWFYTTIELLTGHLYWKNIEDSDKVLAAKKEVRDPSKMSRLLGGCPREFIEIMRLIDATTYYQKPPYTDIYALLRRAIANTHVAEHPYDWERR